MMTVGDDVLLILERIDLPAFKAGVMRHMGLSPDKSIPMAISVKVSRMDSDFLSKNIVRLGSHLSVCRKYNRLVTFGFVKFTKELPY